MIVYKLYMEDEQGNRVMVHNFYPGELAEDRQFNKDAAFKRLLEAKEKLHAARLEPLPKLKPKPGELMSDYDIMVQMLGYSPERAKEALQKLKLQKIEQLKLQVMSENPLVYGVSVSNLSSSDVAKEI
jgi:hypothetical protein